MPLVMITVDWTDAEQQRRHLGDADQTRQACCRLVLSEYFGLSPKFLVFLLSGVP